EDGDGGLNLEPPISGGAFCPLKRGQLSRERRQGCANFSFQAQPGFFCLQKKWGCFYIKKRNGQDRSPTINLQKNRGTSL
ncbi:MAG: hypothetical protein IJO22_08205, partial [Oscillospiraceae bacterium]|nr:hypothetical protein [Oscillospiraceae bacterium]